MRRARGFNLIELLLSLFLGSVLIVGLIHVLLHFNSAWAWQNTWSSLQERGRYAVYLLSSRIRLAGDADCRKPYAVDHAQAIVGYRSDSVPESLQNEVMPGTDVLVIGECVHYHDKSQFIRRAYFIGDTHRKNDRGSPVFALYQKPLLGEREELISDVGDLRVRYGVSQEKDGDISSYRNADFVEDWSRVYSVDLSLTLYSENHRVKKMWPVYIALRER